MREFDVESLRVRVHSGTRAFAEDCAQQAGEILRRAVDERGVARAMFATGNSQLAFVDELVTGAAIAWHSVVVFHMDEYVGIAPDHPASFQRWIRERIVERVKPLEAHYLHGDRDPQAEASRYAALLREAPLDLCCLGIGENGHLAFNDPPVANFDDPLDLKVVDLDAACRRQQVGEGHFPDLDAVPRSAITVTIPALLGAGEVLAIVPEPRKAEPVRQALRGPVSPSCPASVLRTRSNVTLHLDEESASLL